MSAFELGNNFPILTAHDQNFHWSDTLTSAALEVPEDVYNQTTRLTLNLNIENGFGSIGGIISIVSNSHSSTFGNSPNGGQAPSDIDSIGYDWFEKLISKPSKIDLGVFVETAQVINIYSTYRITSQTLQAINVTTGGGSNIVNPPTLPFNLPPQTGITQTYQALENGPPVVSGNIEYIFRSKTITIPVTGLRIVILPWVAESGIVEKLSWKTDVLKAFSRETRRGLRSAPRRQIEYKIFLLENEKSKFEELVKNQTSAFTAVLWWDQYRVNNILSLARTLTLDTTSSEFNVGGLVLIYENDDKFEVREVQSISPTDITLTIPLNNSYSSALIIPTFAAYLNSVSLEEFNNGIYTARISLRIIDHFLIDEPSYTQHRSIDILPDRGVFQSRIPIQIIQSRKFSDNGIGAFKPFAKENRARYITKQTFVKRSYSDRFSFKQWVYSRFGQRKTFFKPTWQNDIQISQDFIVGHTAIVVKTTPYTPNFDIQIELIDGTIIYKQVIGKTAINSMEDQLILGSTIEVAATVLEVYAISILREMRHSSDTISIKYENPDKMSSNVGVTDV